MIDERQGAERTRRRAIWTLFASVAIGNTALIATITVSPLVGQDLTRSATLSGLPWAAGVLGTGAGSVLLSQLMARRGRARGLMSGYGIGAVGALLAVFAITQGLFVLFVVAVVMLGAGNSANHLSRYAAADLYPPEQRGSAVGIVVWAATIGGVAGPALLEPSGSIADRVAVPQLGGPFMIAAVCCAAAVALIFVLGRISRHALVARDADVVASGKGLVEMWRLPQAKIALIALAVSQTVMVLIMAMTPLHIRSSGHGLSSVGIVISAHVFGMYGLSPISGWLTDRLGPVPVILSGFAILAAAALGAAAAPHTAGAWLMIPLFVLGLGWSLSFVAGSSLLTHGLSFGDRARLQGGTDFVVWTSAGVAGLGSGVLVGSFSYALLCIVAAMLIIAPVTMLATSGRNLATAN